MLQLHINLVITYTSHRYTQRPDGLSSVRAEDIANGDCTATLSLLWQLALHLEVWLCKFLIITCCDGSPALHVASRCICLG